jgi:hypothetical protein
MKKKQCSFETRVLAERIQGRAGKEVKNHLNECPACRDSVLIHSWMRGFQDGEKSDSAVEPGIPDFDSLWKKAMTSPAIDRELEKRALIPLLVPRIISVVMMALGILYLLTAKSASIKTFFYSDMKMGVLLNILSLTGRKLLALLPYMMIPLGFIIFFAVGHFLYSLFHLKKS